MTRAALICVFLLIAAVSSMSRGSEFDQITRTHPAGRTLERLFADPAAPLPQDFEPTGLTRRDYLRLIAGNVDFWKHHQSREGAILDPYEKDEKTGKPLEKQYSTPAFALAAAELVAEAGRDDLLDPAVRAFSFALTALVKQTTANQHADFYIPMLIHAHRILRSRVPAETEATWREQLGAIVPEIHYRDKTGGANWNLVNVSGEAMRRRDKLVAATQATTQRAYLDTMLAKQQRRFSKFGMYQDPDFPLAYDAFPRMWMQDMLADGAYEDGKERDAVDKFLGLGSFSSLLLMSPSGEWPCGGRSAHHQWNEAENAVIGEINAAKWKARGRDDIAGVFKRMARMGLKSMFRWRRPSGEMWIVKNFAPPATRFGFEGYSFNSQYNLLPMAMLAIAYERADESISERPIPSEYSSYVFDLRDPFTKVVAACGGYYVEIDTCADAHYNATGLQRIHRRGVELSPLSDSAAGERVIGACKDDPKIALTPGIQWKDGDEWIGLADFHRSHPPPNLKPGTAQPASEPAERVVKATELTVRRESADRVIFSITYDLDGPGAAPINCDYEVSSDGVMCEQQIALAGERGARIVFPAMVNDGARDTQVDIREGAVNVSRTGGTLHLELIEPKASALALMGPRVPTHNGYLRAVVANLRPRQTGSTWKISLTP
jgi:hypothetical protein